VLEKRTSSTGVVYYSSTLLEAAKVPHAFSTRIGGVSPKPFDSLNLGNPSTCAIKDDTSLIRENYRRLLGAIGCAELPLCHVHQVHGNQVKFLRRGEEFVNHAQADAMVSDDPTRVASVRVADCVPILLSRRDGMIVAAIHAGWRGVIANVVGAAIKTMNCEGNEIVAAIGPCIGMEAFEVGGEVLEEFRRAFGDEAPLGAKEGNKGHVDLKAAVKIQLLNAGVEENAIDVSDRCTYRDAEEFFSHRRENGVTGRLAAVIAAKSEIRISKSETNPKSEIQNPKCDSRGKQ
jgi:polyphenol oxidase